MSTQTAPSTHTTPNAQEALASLCQGWLTPTPADYTLVPAAQVPQPFHHLLIHHGHMTEVLRDHYKKEVHLQVQQSDFSAGTYHRRITLSAGLYGPRVELGLVRVNFAFLPAPAKQEILGQFCPLGMVLIRHQILRRVVPHHFLRLPAASPLVRLFNLDVPPILYGRIGTIFCNEQPAIELLEIVTGIPPTPN